MASVKTHSYPAIALLCDDHVVNIVGWFVDTCDDALLLKVTACLIQVVGGVRGLAPVLDHWLNAAVHLDVVRLLALADTGEDISVDFKEAIFH